MRGLLLLAGSDLGGPVNIGNPDEATVGEIAARIIAIAGSSSPVRYVARPTDDPMSRKPDITLAHALLGFEPQVRWQEGLAETVEWFRSLMTRPAFARGEKGRATSWRYAEGSLPGGIPQAGGTR